MTTAAAVRRGIVTATRGAFVDASLPLARLAEGVAVVTDAGRVAGRVVSLRAGGVTIAPFRGVDGIARGDRVDGDRFVLALPLGTPLLGRAIDPAGNALDGGLPPLGRRVPVDADPTPLTDRRPCTAIAWTGIAAIDAALAFGRGARIGLFGPAGCGKSTLLEAIVRGIDADAIVVGLIGERAREAERWVARCDARTTIVCATGDRTAPERIRAAEVAVAQADALRARGLDVVLVLDSLARICGAAREVAVALGEPVGRGGYPPAAFASLARLLERGGVTPAGSLTIVATVLCDGFEEGDPVGEQARAMLDGHVVLSRRLADAGCFPAIDLLASTSRTFADIATDDHRSGAQRLRAAMAALAEIEDARSVGLDPGANDPFLARCIGAERTMHAFLRDPARKSPGQTLTELRRIADMLG